MKGFQNTPPGTVEQKEEKLTYETLYKQCEEYLIKLLKENLPKDSKAFLFGSRARGDCSRNSDIDIGILAGNLDNKIIVKMKEIIDESFIPFDVDIVDFSKVKDSFKKEALRSAVQWI